MTFNNHTNKSILKTFLRYAIPSTIAMLVTSLYVVIEGVVLGRGVGAHALAAVNIAFPATILINAFVIAISVGGANLMSIRLGEEKQESANNIFMQSMAMMVAVAVVFVSLGNIYLRQICVLLGADDALLPDVMIFVRCYLLTSFLFVINMGLNTFIRNDGNPKLSMYSALTSTIATIIIVYTFVIIFKLGVAGAAIAGGVGNIFSLAVLSIHFIKKKGILRFSKPTFNRAEMLKICSLGLPSMLTEMAMAFTTVCFNIVIMRRVGEIGVSAYSITNYVNAFIILILMGISQGLQPIVSFNYGAKETKVVSHTYKIALVCTLAVSFVTILLIYLFGEDIIRIFSNESQQLVALTKTVLLFACLAYIPAGINMVNITYYQSIENPRLSSFISILRGFVLIQTGLLVLPIIFGNNGIWIASLVGETLALILSLLMGIRFKQSKLPRTNDIANEMQIDNKE